MPYVQRDSQSNEITGYSDAPNPGFEFIEANDAEYLQWHADLAAAKLALKQMGFTKTEENYVKLFILELVKEYKNNLLVPAPLKQAAQDVFDNVD